MKYPTQTSLDGTNDRAVIEGSHGEQHAMFDLAPDAVPVPKPPGQVEFGTLTDFEKERMDPRQIAVTTWRKKDDE